jgi:hypothetical protein
MVNSAKRYRFAVHFSTREPERDRLVTEYFRTAAAAAERIGCTRNTVFNMLQGKPSRLGQEYRVERVDMPTERAAPVPSREIYDPAATSDDSD